jgi:ribonucleoside-diphosphate reductase alpha chain
MPDEMIRRIEKNEEIYLVDPGECPELVDTYGDDFNEKYNERIRQAEAGAIKQFKKLKGRDFFVRYLFKLAKTGHPWLTFKDEHNRHNPCKAYGVINSSNLCTEISIPNSSRSTAVCTLASVNLSKHLNKDRTDFDWKKMDETIQIMVRALDNVLDRNFYPSETARKNTMDLRPLGIGIMGLAEAFVSLGIAYDSEEAVLLSGRIGEFMKKTAYAASEKLAAEKAPFAHYTEMQKQGVPYPYKARRNAVLLAIAPTATISIIAGTTSSIDSYFSNVYSRDTLSGKFIVINRQLIRALEEKGMWNEEMADIIKMQNGSVQHIPQLEGKIDLSLYKTAFEIHPDRQIEIASALQASIDQAVSKSLYIDEQLRDSMPEIYIKAWKSRLKSTYYCFIDKVNKGEKYTSTVNKRGNRRGFGGTDSTAGKQNEDLNEIEKQAREKYGDDMVDEIKKGKNDSCPTDPLLAKICPSCE